MCIVTSFLLCKCRSNEYRVHFKTLHRIGLHWAQRDPIVTVAIFYNIIFQSILQGPIHDTRKCVQI